LCFFFRRLALKIQNVELEVKEETEERRENLTEPRGGEADNTVFVVFFFFFFFLYFVSTTIEHVV
jgi:hypothetical protein